MFLLFRPFIISYLCICIILDDSHIDLDVKYNPGSGVFLTITKPLKENADPFVHLTFVNLKGIILA